MNKNQLGRQIGDYGYITVIVTVMTFVFYFFQLPNHFVFGGVTGLAVLLSSVTALSFSILNLSINLILILAGFLCIGRKFGVRTVYVTLLSSLQLRILEIWIPVPGPVTDQPVLEMIVVIFTVAIVAASLFQRDACSGGTDIAAMIIQKYVKIDIGKALFCVDLVTVLFSFVIYDASIGLFSLLGLMCKAFVIDTCIESLNLNKYFTIICRDPDAVCRYIRQDLGRGATVYQAEGSHTREKKYVVMTVVKRSQAILLRSFIRSSEPDAFLVITNSSEVVGKGFLLE